MTKDNWPFVPTLAPIPSVFHSLELDGPFTKCVLCAADLLGGTGDRTYFIERVFRGTEPIIEYAMCLGCQVGMRSELSQQSLHDIETFLREIDYQPRIDRLQKTSDFHDLSPWLDECLVTGKHRSKCRDYQIFALCQGNQLAIGNLPGMLSDDAVESLTKLLSKKTRDRLEDFVGENFGMPPEFCDAPNFTPLLV